MVSLNHCKLFDMFSPRCFSFSFARNTLQRLVNGTGIRPVVRFTYSGDSKRPFEESNVSPMEAPGCHGIFDSTDGCAVYKSMNDALQSLEKRKDTNTSSICELLEIVNDCGLQTDKVNTVGKYPLIVIEGLDGTGKSTLTEALSTKLRAKLMTSPPPVISHLREWFDQQEPLVRRAFYSVGNYISAQGISDELRNRPVVLDRFWHSTSAYAIATACMSAAVLSQPPPHGHWVYTWPPDLLRPHVVFLLTLEEEARTLRIQKRTTTETQEEKKLAVDILFRKRLCDAYRSMTNPCMVDIDASLSPEEVVEKVMLHLKQANII